MQRHAEVLLDRPVRQHLEVRVRSEHRLLLGELDRLVDGGTGHAHSRVVQHEQGPLEAAADREPGARHGDVAEELGAGLLVAPRPEGHAARVEGKMKGPWR